MEELEQCKHLNILISFSNPQTAQSYVDKEKRYYCHCRAVAEDANGGDEASVEEGVDREGGEANDSTGADVDEVEG